MPVKHKGVCYPAADAHAHIYPAKIAEKATASVGDFYGLRMGYVGLPSVLAEAGGNAGVDRFLVCSVATKAEQVGPIQQFIQSACAQYPQFVGLGAWHPDIADVSGELDNLQRRGLRGVKLHPDFQGFPIDSPAMLPFFQAAAERKLPVLIHMGDSRGDLSSPERLARLLDRAPGLTVIAAHLGGYTQWAQARQWLKGSGVYTDCSSSLAFLSQEEARESFAAFGPERVLFGTDFPMWPVEKELARFFALGLTDEENRQVLSGNFARLFQTEVGHG